MSVNQERAAELEEALRTLHRSMRAHVIKMGSIAPVHPSVYSWADYIEDILAKPPKERSEG